MKYLRAISRKTIMDLVSFSYTGYSATCKNYLFIELMSDIKIGWKKQIFPCKDALLIKRMVRQYLKFASPIHPGDRFQVFCVEGKHVHHLSSHRNNIFYRNIFAGIMISADRLDKKYINSKIFFLSHCQFDPIIK